MKFDTVLFDLDGTITDSGEGIINCVKYALDALNITENDIEMLKAFIGPPLREMFKTSYNLSDKEADFAIMKYRERYNNTGIYENKVYDKIEDILKMLYEKNVCICLATSKPEVYAIRILEHFGLKKYFSYITGSEFDGRRTEKTEVISCALSKLDPPYNAIMVGDRKYDILSSHECSIKCIGVKFGFPEKNELEEAGADCICETTEDLMNILKEITK